MRVDIKLAHFTIKSRFKDDNFKFYQKQILKALKMRRVNNTKVQDVCENYEETKETA